MLEGWCLCARNAKFFRLLEKYVTLLLYRTYKTSDIVALLSFVRSICLLKELSWIGEYRPSTIPAYLLHPFHGTKHLQIPVSISSYLVIGWFGLETSKVASGLYAPLLATWPANRPGLGRGGADNSWGIILHFISKLNLYYNKVLRQLSNVSLFLWTMD